MTKNDDPHTQSNEQQHINCVQFEHILAKAPEANALEIIYLQIDTQNKKLFIRTEKLIIDHRTYGNFDKNRDNIVMRNEE